jgi:hypothetical protein
MPNDEERVKYWVLDEESVTFENECRWAVYCIAQGSDQRFTL